MDINNMELDAFTISRSVCRVIHTIPVIVVVE
jgi:hypothetical protein